MPSHFQSLLPLLLIIPSTWASTAAECLEPNTCYGMPVNCHPDDTPTTNCHLILQFDVQGNLDLYIHDVVDPMGFVAIAVDTTTDQKETEYVICIPHQGQRFRAIAIEDEPIRIIEQPMTEYVRRISPNTFVCPFLATELPKGLQYRQVFSVVKGVFEENMVIPQGEPQPLVAIHPIAFRSSDSVSDDGVLSPDERKATSDLLGKLRRINGEDTDDLESLLEDKKDGDSGEEDLEDMLDEEKKFSTRRRQQDKKKASERRRQETEDEEEEEKPRRRSSRQSRYQEEDDEGEEEEEEEIPKRKSNKKNRRIADSEEDEDEEEDDEWPPKKKNTKKGGRRGGRKEKDLEEDDEEKDDEYEDEKGSNTDDDYGNGSNNNINVLITISAITALLVMLTH